MKKKKPSAPPPLDRLLQALSPDVLERVARAYDLEGAPSTSAELAEALRTLPWVTPREIVHEVLLPRELAPLARRLGIPAQGTAVELRVRLTRVLHSSGPRRFRAFGPARAFARKLGLGSYAEWVRWCAGELPDKPPRPADIPSNPSKHYHDKGWQGWGDWLGTGTVGTVGREFWSFTRARQFARSLKLRTSTEWAPWSAGHLPGKPPRPPEMPSNPQQKYAEQWAGYRDWLGLDQTGPAARRSGAKKRTAAAKSAGQAQRSSKATRKRANQTKRRPAPRKRG